MVPGGKHSSLWNCLELDWAYPVYYGRSPTKWFRLIMNILNRSRELHDGEVAPLTSQTLARAVFRCLFDHLPVWISTSNLHHRILRKKISIRSELMILEGSFPLITNQDPNPWFDFLIIFWLFFSQSWTAKKIWKESFVKTTCEDCEHIPSSLPYYPHHPNPMSWDCHLVWKCHKKKWIHVWNQKSAAQKCFQGTA